MFWDLFFPNDLISCSGRISQCYLQKLVNTSYLFLKRALLALNNIPVPCASPASMQQLLQLEIILGARSPSQQNVHIAEEGEKSRGPAFNPRMDGLKAPLEFSSPRASIGCMEKACSKAGWLRCFSQGELVQVTPFSQPHFSHL